jgi:hypothetical protein
MPVKEYKLLPTPKFSNLEAELNRLAVADWRLFYFNVLVVERNREIIALLERDQPQPK